MRHVLVRSVFGNGQTTYNATIDEEQGVLVVMTNGRKAVYGWPGHGEFEIVAYSSPIPIYKVEVGVARNTVADVVEEQYRAALKPIVEPGHCVCGIHKSRCAYHGP